MLEIKIQFEFDRYLLEESMWGFKVLIGKRKGLIWGCEEEWKERILWYLGAEWTVPVNKITRKERRKERREREKRTQKGQHASMLKTLNNFINQLPPLSTLSTNI